MTESSLAVATEFPKVTPLYAYHGNDAEFSVDIPDPANFDISDQDFQLRARDAWAVCAQINLQTEIWRGRILRAVRDRESRKGLATPKGSGFMNWVTDFADIGRAQAYILIDLADAADRLLEGGLLTAQNIDRFSKRSLIAAASAPENVQTLLMEKANGGDRVTQEGVKTLVSEYQSVASDMLPEELKQSIANDSIPRSQVSPLVKQMTRLPLSHQHELQNALRAGPNADTVKEVTATARYLAKYLDAANGIAAFKDQPLNLEAALEEAMRLDQLSPVADMLSQAAAVENAMVKLFLAWKRLNKLTSKVYLEAGASTPNLLAMLQRLEHLSGNDLETVFGGGEDGESICVCLEMKPKS